MELPTSSIAHHVAVIGGGIGGASFVTFLESQAAPTGGGAITMDVFEAEPNVGGRLKSVHVDGVKVELGGTFYSPDLNPTIAALFVQAQVATYPLLEQLEAADLLVFAGGNQAPHLALRHDPPGRYALD